MPIVFTLNETMKELGINQKELSEISGVRPNTISEIRKGNANALRVETMDALLDAINRLAADQNKTYGLDAIVAYQPPGTP